MQRSGWNDYFMKFAQLAAERSTCKRRHVGAVLVKNNQVIATGYNGAPVKLKHCDEVGCIREKMNIPSGQRHELCRGVHAEANVIIQAARHGAGCDNATLYVTHSPCSACAKMIVNAGIGRVVIENDSPDELSAGILKEAGIETVRYQ